MNNYHRPSKEQSDETRNFMWSGVITMCFIFSITVLIFGSWGVWIMSFIWIFVALSNRVKIEVNQTSPILNPETDKISLEQDTDTTEHIWTKKDDEFWEHLD